MKPRLLTGLLLACLMMTTLAAGLRPRTTHPQAAAPLLMPLGGGYLDVYAGFSAAAAANARDGRVKILVLPSAYATDPYEISETERSVHLEDAERRRLEIEAACREAVTAPEATPSSGSTPAAGLTCEAVLAPVFTRADAENPDNVALLTPDLAAVFILGGNQTVAMQILAGTAFELVMADLYAQGVIVAGTSAGAAVQSQAMLGGYNPGYSTGSALAFGAADLWHTAERRGLPFGLENAVLEQHFYQRGRLGRLLNAIALPGAPHVGVGVDASTGVHAPEGARLEDVFGLYSVTVLDAATYHAAEGVQYRGPAHLLSLRNVLVHLLAPGGSSYDLDTRQHSLAPVPPRLERTFAGLRVPPGAGLLILGGDLEDSLANHPLREHFIRLSGGEAARFLVVAAGYPAAASAQRAADRYAAALGAPSDTWVVDPQDEVPPPPDSGAYGGLVWVVGDPSRLPEDPAAFEASFAFLREAWENGTPLLADDGAAAAAGAFYSAHGPTPPEPGPHEQATQKSFLAGQTVLRPGLGLLDANFEPQVLGDNRWGRLFSLAYNHPRQLAVGLTADTALLVGPDGAAVYGDNVVFTLDLSAAALGLGSNDGFVIANGLLDVFAPGERLSPVPADVDAAPVPAGTPVFPTATLTPTQPPPPTPTETATPVPAEPLPPPEETNPPRRTPTPVVIPPLPNPNLNNLMILITVLGVLIVIAGVLINRQRTFHEDE